MIMSEEKTTDRLLQTSQEFLVPIRMGEGFKVEKFEDFCAAIRQFDVEWKGRDSIPKIVAGLFVDAYTAMVASSYLYPSQTSDIQQQADLMNDLIRASLQ
jgi:hypothetical protein